jgi:O-antigen/teichoic acid export membrane protein
MNLVMPVFQINGALGLVLTSVLTLQQQKSRLSTRHLVPFFAVYLAVDMLLGVALVVGAGRIMGLAYGDAYHGAITIVPVLAAVPVVTGLCTVMRAWAFALDFPQAQFWSSLAYAVVAVAAVPFLSASPLRIAALGMLASAIVYLVTVATIIARKVRVSDGSSERGH